MELKNWQVRAVHCANELTANQVDLMAELWWDEQRLKTMQVWGLKTSGLAVPATCCTKASGCSVVAPAVVPN